MRNYEKIPLIDYVRDWELGFDEPMDVVAANFESVKTLATQLRAPVTTAVEEWKIAPSHSKVLAHGGAVRWLQFLPQNEFNRHWLITGSDDRFVTGWDFTGRRVFQEQASSRDGVNAVAFSNDGSYAAAASNGSTVRIYNLAINPSDPPAAAFEGHADSVTSVEFDPTSKYVVSASADRTVRIISADGAKQYQSSGQLAGIATFARFSPTAPFVVSSCDDAVVRLHLLSPYDKRGTVNRLGPTLAGPVRRAHFSANGEWVAASGGKFSYVLGVPRQRSGQPKSLSM
jgi:WD40 repeat protein